MRRDTLNFLVDLVGLLAMLGLMITGLIMKYLLPPGSRGGWGLSLWGWTRHEWGDLHFWLAVALVAMLVLHVALHWTWVAVLVKRWVQPRAERPAVSALVRNLTGLAFLLAVAALVAGFVWLARANVTQRGSDEEREEPRRRRGRAAFVLPSPPMQETRPAAMLPAPQPRQGVQRSGEQDVVRPGMFHSGRAG